MKIIGKQNVPLISEKKKRMFKKLILLSLLLIAGRLFGQMDYGSQQISYYVPPIAILTVASNELPTGNFIEESDSLIFTSWINYSSIVSFGSHNKITVCAQGGQIPSDGKIHIQASFITESGGGELGITAENLILTDHPQELIGHIGSCYTGQGAGVGAKISYYWNQDDKESIARPGNSITLVYTILPAD